ncbi:MAG: fumarylacetoacetate hydrolase family protein [Candidatus Nanopelagicales bacterium]
MLAPEVDVASVAARLDGARLSGATLDAASVPVGDLATAYAVQDALTARRVARGARRVGWKLGYTSTVMREQMGIDDPNVGPLLDTMRRTTGATVGEGLLQPRVEPEVALVLDVDVAAPLEPHEALAACREAVVALEVVDSVWTAYAMDLEHNTADGSSAAHVVVGPPLPLEVLADVEVALLRNGSRVGTGAGRDALGHPAAALSWLTAVLAARGEALRAGDLVLTGGLTAAVPLEPGDVVHAEFEHPSMSLRRVAVRR